MNWHRFVARHNPAVPRNWLLVLAGLTWSAVGILLCSFALTWVIHPATTTAVALGLLGLALSVVINYLGFARLARKNIERILAYDERACAFAFQAWKSYLIVVIMMTGGIMLRHSAIPRPYLAVVYAAIGAALLQASVNYYIRLGQLSFTRTTASTD